MSRWDDLFTPPPSPPITAGGPTLTIVPNTGNATSYAAAALRNEATEVANAPEGTRNHTLNRAAFRMGRHIGAGNIDATTVRQALEQAARQAGLPQHEIDLVLRDDTTSAINNGTLVPRHPATELPDPPQVTVIDQDTPAATEPSLSQLVRDRFPLIDFTELLNSEDDGEEWIVEPLLPARRLIALYSAPKVGKSLLMLEIAVGIALGREVLGTTPEPRKVLYVDFENDPRGDVKRRLEAMGLGPEDGDALNHGLCYLSFPTIAKLDTHQGGYELLATAQEYGCDVIVIDTVSRAVGGEENDNDTWLAFYRDTGMLLKGAGIACIRLDHSGKDADKGMRGGSAKYGDVDAVWKLTAESETVLNLDCTDRRMPVEHDRVTLIREAHPTLHHRVVGDRTMALDAREKEVDDTIDRLGIDTASLGANAVYKALRDAGRGYNKATVLRVVKARKMRLTAPDHSGSGTTLEPPGTTPEVSGSRSAPLKGGSGTTSGHPVPGTRTTPKTETFDPLLGERLAPAWTAAASVLKDGKWHHRYDLIEAMGEVSDLVAKTRSQVLRDAVHNGWLEIRGEYPNHELRVTAQGRERDELAPMFVVGCKKCHAPTDRDQAHANNGHCDSCTDTEENKP